MLASMRLGGAVATLALITAGTLVTAQLIVAFVAARQRRAFAVGFLIALFAYMLPHGMSGLDSLDPYSKQALPTTRAFQTLHQNLCSRVWRDYHSKAVIPEDDPRVKQLKINGGTVMMTAAGMVTLHETPSRLTFALLAHTAIALVLGVVGGAYALRVYRVEYSE